MLSARPAWMFSASPMCGVASIVDGSSFVSPVVRNLRGLLFGGGGLGRKPEAPDGTVIAVLQFYLGGFAGRCGEPHERRVVRLFRAAERTRVRARTAARRYLPTMRRVAVAACLLAIPGAAACGSGNDEDSA